MRAGDLRHRIRLQRRSQALDPLGQPASAWLDVATVWAEVLPLSGRELVAGQAVHAEVSHSVTIRYQPQFGDPRALAAMRILYGSRILNIHAALDVEERHKTIALACSEGLNDG